MAERSERKELGSPLPLPALLRKGDRILLRQERTYCAKLCIRKLTIKDDQLGKITGPVFTIDIPLLDR